MQWNILKAMPATKHLLISPPQNQEIDIPSRSEVVTPDRTSPITPNRQHVIAATVSNPIVPQIERIAVRGSPRKLSVAGLIASNKIAKSSKKMIICPVL